ncbi:FeoB-associated Cys-rich membrane protein [Eubacteriales bacterium OttesenSCG-928-M02]|nr:FeoB-associated Cys-rich membrane protein [Eubacteriales bacterium OttesenSCG-928-M02]
MATILVGALVLGGVIAIVAGMYRDKKKNPGKGSCGCSCDSCPYTEKCE